MLMKTELDRIWHTMAQPFPDDQVLLSPGKGGVTLVYADERQWLIRLNAAATQCGLSWSRSFAVLAEQTTIIRDEQTDKHRTVTKIERIPTMVRCTITIGSESREGIGNESTIEEEKGAASDAFKRACVPWGGIYFYFFKQFVGKYDNEDTIRRELPVIRQKYLELLPSIEAGFIPQDDEVL